MPSAVRRTTSSMVARASCEAVMSRKTSSSAPCVSYASAASTGSPASRRSTKRTPLTTRPSFTSRQGITRLANIIGTSAVRPVHSVGGVPWAQRGGRRVAGAPPDVEDSRARDLGPATDRDARAPPVHGDDHPRGPRTADLMEELRVEGGPRPHDRPACAGGERAADRLEIAQTAARLYGDRGDPLHDRREVLEEPEPPALAFLRMELGRVDPPLFDRGRELDPVLAPRRAKGRAPRTPVRLPQATLGLSRARGRRYDRVIGVDEVEMGARRDALEEAQLPRVLDAVPTHMRNLPARREPPYHPRDHVEAASLAELLARRKQELVAEADAEKRPAPVQRPPEGREEAEVLEVRHGVVERSVAWEHDGVRLVHGAWILGHDRRDADAAERLFDRPEVAPAVIDNGDHRLASPAAAAAARTATITDSPRLRLRLRLALPRSQTRLACGCGCGSHCHDHRLTGRPSSTGRFPRCAGSPAWRRRARGRRP